MTEQHEVRVEKVASLRAMGMDPYPAKIDITDSVVDVRSEYTGLDKNEWTGQMVTIGGRVKSLRNNGNICFVAIVEGEASIQLIIEKNTLGIDSLKAFKQLVDLGDIISVTGEVGASSTGELSVKAHKWTMASKCLHPLPSKTEGLADTEIIRRNRHLDLLIGGDSKRILQARSTVFRSIRTTLWSDGFDEVDTPILQKTHGGATARPFVTHANALGQDLSLRIAPELYLKRLMVGGSEKIFEIGPNFRNEGIDSRHSPEFMMLEAYAAWGDYVSMRETIKNIITNAAKAVNGTTVVTINDVEVDLAADWRVATMHVLVSEALNTELTSASTLDEFQAAGEKNGYTVTKPTAGEALVELFEEFVEKTLVEPTFVTDWPIEVRPLTREHRDDPRLTESWDLIIGGREIGTAYSELVDPIEQRRRLVEQSLKAAAGDEEAMSLDEDFLNALEYGMVPTGGMGLGIDRVIMLITGTDSIRDTITFPLNK